MLDCIFFPIFLSLHGFSMTSLREEFTSNFFSLGFDHVTDCDYWNIGGRESTTALNRLQEA